MAAGLIGNGGWGEAALLLGSREKSSGSNERGSSAPPIQLEYLSRVVGRGWSALVPLLSPANARPLWLP